VTAQAPDAGPSLASPEPDSTIFVGQDGSSVLDMTMTNSVLTTLLYQIPPVIPDGAEVMIVTVEVPPGDPGTRAFRPA
jgi:hypothetical protein